MARNDAGPFYAQEIRGLFISAECGFDTEAEAVECAQQWRREPVNDGDRVRVLHEGKQVWPKLDTGAAGWPLIASTKSPELLLACPKCYGTDVTMTVKFTGIGTGPGGRHRMGDPCKDANICNGCGFRS